jgi:TATA-box binding protein (TBP) (component of TFIID and TFIIIB)
LDQLTAFLGPCVQYRPSKFAGNIITLATCLGTANLLVFGSGQAVIVATLSDMHTLFYAHVLRLLVEQIECLIQFPGEPEPRLGTLKGLTVLNNLDTTNVVGHGFLGVPINLDALRDANPTSVKYQEDDFPAAKCSVWITEERRCVCHKARRPVLEADVSAALPRMGKGKCTCKINCHIFKDGKIVLMGARDITALNRVFFQMRDTAIHFTPDATKGRFEDSLASMFVMKNKTAKVQEARELGESEMVSLLLTQSLDTRAKRTRAKPVTQENLIMRFLEHGSLREFTIAMQADPEQWAMAESFLGRLAELEPTENRRAIAEMLKQRTKTEAVTLVGLDT